MSHFLWGLPKPSFLLFLAMCLGLSGCSAALMTVGVLDEPDQNRMFQSLTRIEFEEIAGKPISSRITPTMRIVCHYQYVDGEAGVVGKRKVSFAGIRKAAAIYAPLFGFVLEPIAVPTTMWARKEATRNIYVIYDSSENIQAMCRVSKQANPLCASELSHEEDIMIEEKGQKHYEPCKY